MYRPDPNRPTPEPQIPVRPQPRAAEPPEQEAAPLAFEDVPAAPMPKPRKRPDAATKRRRRVVRWGVAGVCALAVLWYCFSPSEQSPQAQFATAVAYLKSGDAAHAAPLLKELAEAGFAPAYAKMAECCLAGQGGAKAAEQWYRKAEQSGDAAAVIPLAELYFDGACGKPDYYAAAQRYTRQADKLTAEQLYRLAQCHIKLAEEAGAGYEADHPELAVRWLTRAAEQGVLPAQLELATRHYKGVGTPASLGAAQKWFAAAAQQGDAEAQFRLAWCYRESVPADNDKAFHWFLQAAKQGAPAPQYDLALCYMDGCGTATSPAEALVWLSAAAKQNHPAALRTLAFCYRDGTACEANPSAAVACFSQAAQLGDAEAQYNLAWCLQKGYYVQPNSLLAMDWYRKAAAQGYAPALDMLRSLEQNAAESAPAPEAQEADSSLPPPHECPDLEAEEV